MRLFYSTQFTQTHLNIKISLCLFADSLDGSRANKEFVTQTRNTNTSWTANSINFSSFIHVYQINCPRFNGAYSQEKNLRCTKSARKGTSSLLQLHTLYSFIWQLSDECFIAARAIPIYANDDRTAFTFISLWRHYRFLVRFVFFYKSK